MLTNPQTRISAIAEGQADVTLFAAAANMPELARAFTSFAVALNNLASQDPEDLEDIVDELVDLVNVSFFEAFDDLRTDRLESIFNAALLQAMAVANEFGFEI